MPEIIGVQFRPAGKIYYFSPNNLNPGEGEHVIVETTRGIEYATVKQGITTIPEAEVPSPLKDIIRIATPEDADTHTANLRKAKEARDICFEKIKEHQLKMKLVDVEYTFDNNKIIFYFTADGRVDFRELVKDLAGVFHTRIELRQIGVRDEAKIIGGVGICGLALCCHRFIGEFSPVSIKMAKEQNLSLNPAKISGCCGRLLCCLNYENAHYIETNRLNAQARKEAAQAAPQKPEEAASSPRDTEPDSKPETESPKRPSQPRKGGGRQQHQPKGQRSAAKGRRGKQSTPFKDKRPGGKHDTARTRSTTGRAKKSHD